MRHTACAIQAYPFDVGQDTGTQVVEDYAGQMPFKFTGKLDSFTIELK